MDLVDFFANGRFREQGVGNRTASGVGPYSYFYCAPMEGNYLQTSGIGWVAVRQGRVPERQ